MSNETTWRTEEVEKRRPNATPHLRDACNAIEAAIEAFGDWWPSDPECAATVSRLIVAADIVETEMSSAKERMMRHVNERLLAAIERHDEEQHVKNMAAIRAGQSKP